MTAGASPDVLWERIKPLLPPCKPPLFRVPQPPRVPNRRAIDASSLCSAPPAHGVPWMPRAYARTVRSTAASRREAWVESGVFLALWQAGLDKSWLSMDGAQTKAPLGKNRENPTDRGKRGTGHQAEGAVPGTAVGGGAHPPRDEPVSPDPDPLGRRKPKTIWLCCISRALDRIQSV